MRSVLAIAQREVIAFFATPVGWLCLTAFAAISGFFFAMMATEFSVQATTAAYNPYVAEQINLNDWLVQPFFANTSVVLLMLSPALSMRLFAEDRANKSLELLLSSPVTSGQIVLGKFLGALGFVSVMLASTLPLTAMLYWLGTPDTGILLSCYLSAFLLSASFLSVGLLTSAMTENQIVALVTGSPAVGALGAQLGRDHRRRIARTGAGRNFHAESPRPAAQGLVSPRRCGLLHHLCWGLPVRDNPARGGLPMALRERLWVVGGTGLVGRVGTGLTAATYDTGELPLPVLLMGEWRRPDRPLADARPRTDPAAAPPGARSSLASQSPWWDSSRHWLSVQTSSPRSMMSGGI